MSKGWIILVGIAFILGIPVGYYLYPHAPVDSVPSSVIQVITAAGTVILILKSLRDYFKELALEYGDLYRKQEYREGLIEMGFYLRVKQKRGKGRTKCEALMTIEESNGKKVNISTIWEGTDSKYREISIQNDLKLFHLSEDGENIFLFPQYEDIPSKKPIKPYEAPTANKLNSILSVTLGASEGVTPKEPFRMKIGNIINNAIEEQDIQNF